MGGMELLKALRHRVPEINCIIISADANLEKAIKAARLGASSFLEKPVEVEQLLMDLRKCFEHSNSGSGHTRRTRFNLCISSAGAVEVFLVDTDVGAVITGNLKQQ